MSDQPPPYRPFFPEGPPSAGFPPAFCSPPAAFHGPAYQTFPQTATGGDPIYLHPGHLGHQEALVTQPGYHGNKQEAPHPPKHTVYVMEPHRRQDDGVGSYLAACSAALCCCCLWDLLHR
ncbi:cysteine-rich and transmembrane domain-containing protein 1-like [Melanotaenia boesemani]|uniref:cysteine-rich and transmembrane domain-containing protein 1-like n=1 Tax=Melanotaenia boesemani TaxID=1250792 RepID=UPI001C0586F0|nr:cysteine-rich and transmembrane domain-containing protein 1-like [Melanotaenia boesemani]